MPTQNCCTRGKTVTKKSGKSKTNESSQGRDQSWWEPSRAWEARVEWWLQEKVAWKRKNLQWRKQQQQQPTSQKLPGVSPKQSTISGSFVKSYKKKGEGAFKKKWLQKYYWYYIYVWCGFLYGGDFDI